MEQSDLRTKFQSLAEDLGWLENHCKEHPEQSTHTTHIRLAAALSRNVLSPSAFANDTSCKPLHVAVVGGAGAGKSTVVNFLVGQVVADANPQAGYTRHPSAFIPSTLAGNWPTVDQFLGPLKKAEGKIAANQDEDVYQKVDVKKSADDPLADWVVWDCPDMTTVAAGHYASRLTEVAALADVIIYVASDERYNDEIPTQYLHLLIRAGKAVIVCLTKMKVSDSDALIQHFQSEVLGKLPALPNGMKPTVPVIAIPNIPQSERNDPAGTGSQYRIALLNQILALSPNSDTTRKRTVENGRKFLQTAADGLLEVARSDIKNMDAWKKSVQAGRAGFEDRYRREFLAGESFRRFDKTRDELHELIELPGKAKSVSVALSFVRWPYQKVRDFLYNLISRPSGLALPERDVLNNSLTGWLDGLQAESIRNATIHPVWRNAAGLLGTGAKQTAQDRFTLALRDFETSEIQELESEGKNIVSKLQSSNALLNVIRYGKLALEILTVLLLIYWLWPPGWLMLLAIPLGVYFIHQIAEWIIRLTVETARAKIRSKRLGLVTKHLTGPLEAWLNELPASQGSSIERLNQVLSRVPNTIKEITNVKS